MCFGVKGRQNRPVEAGFAQEQDTNVIDMDNQVRKPIRPWQTLAGLVVVGLFLLAMACSVLPEVHQCLHGHEASAAEHHCLSVTLSDGKLESTETPWISVAPGFAGIPETSSPYVGPILPRRSFLLPPGRDPPDFSSHS
jgi:hypothetical protein